METGYQSDGEKSDDFVQLLFCVSHNGGKEGFMHQIVPPPPNTVGFIHTAEIEIREEEVGTALFEAVTANAYFGITRDVISGRAEGNRRKHWRYNPNSFIESTGLPYDHNNYYGRCQDAENFEKGLKAWLNVNKPLSRGDVHVVRLDYALDEQHPHDERRICRTYEAIVHNFASIYKIHKRDQYRTETLLTREQKSTAAGKGCVSMELYNRQMKHPQSRVKWRFEIRYGEYVHNRPAASLWPDDMLEHLKAVMNDNRMQDLQNLESEMNRHLLKKYKATAKQDTYTTVKASYEFIRRHADCIFTRHQLAALLKLLNPGLSDDEATKKARRQLERHPSAYCIINARDYQATLQNCIEQIDAFIVSYKQYWSTLNTPLRGVSIAEAMKRITMEMQGFEESMGTKIDSTDTARCARFSHPLPTFFESEEDEFPEDDYFFPQLEEQAAYFAEHDDPPLFSDTDTRTMATVWATSFGHRTHAAAVGEGVYQSWNGMTLKTS